MVKVQRFDPLTEHKPAMQNYRVPYIPGMSVSDALHSVNEQYGDAVAYLTSCRLGMCGCCLVKVNGTVRLACCTPVEGDFTVEPAFPELVIKDLVTSKGTVKTNTIE